jgi:two-component system sensor histidine kinase BarA
MRILLAEDDVLSAQFLRYALQDMGHRLDWVCDGKVALQKAQAEHFDVLLFDLGLPALSGDQVLLALRQTAHALSASSRAIALTADLNAHQQVQLLDLGFSQVASKPISIDRLRRLIQSSTLQVSEPLCEQPSRVELCDLDDEAALLALGDMSIVRDLRELLARELPKQMVALKTSIAQEQNDQAIAVLHQLKSSTRFCGALALAALADELSTALQKKDEIQSIFERFCDSVERLLRRLSETR